MWTPHLIHWQMPKVGKRRKRPFEYAPGEREGGGVHSTQSWISTVKLIEKAVVVNLQSSSCRRSGHTPKAHNLEVVYNVTSFLRSLQ